MRDIKFRVWDDDPQVQQMFYSTGLSHILFGGSQSDIGLGIDLHWSVKNAFRGWHRERSFRKDLEDGVLVFEQSTGLADKNGIKIYEGDRVSFWGGEGTVVLDEGCFVIRYTENDYFTINARDVEVIGNIHEKPE